MIPAKSKQFFFEKKNQKTFDCWAPSCRKRGAKNQKFFASFFQKSRPSVLTTHHLTDWHPPP
jgi:hypothetical protein